jgi:hypothetical protein
LTLSALNHNLTSDAYFITIAILMMLGYVTVGAFVASRLPRNPLGWLLMTTGVAFLLAAASDEYATYALYTSPGALPFGQFRRLAQQLDLHRGGRAGRVCSSHCSRPAQSRRRGGDGCRGRS